MIPRQLDGGGGVFMWGTEGGAMHDQAKAIMSSFLKGRRNNSPLFLSQLNHCGEQIKE